ncbi:hypothetical protein MSAN_00117700 [Mycena sanguinolenta]|uniref:Uncharacterized protein n=1 Tax=Mycena sanguinolenta TaxID=230812 RepID=A0A8H6ZDF0_9AGAR|nr:hypothetical protein MSAN_00117700 [Mycena sanguinolenta]
MFSHSQQFTVAGGTFSNTTNNNYTAAPSLPSDFRMIPMGDIDLQQQIRGDERTGVAYSRPSNECVFPCIKEVTQNNDNLQIDAVPPELPRSSRIDPVSAETITTFIDSLTLEQYHHICDWNPRQYRRITIFAATTVNAGQPCCNILAMNAKNSVNIALLPNEEAPCLNDWTTFEGETVYGDLADSVSSRSFWSGDVLHNTLSIFVYISRGDWDWDTWLSQANYIFRRLHIVSEFQDYGTASTHIFYLR